MTPHARTPSPTALWLLRGIAAGSRYGFDLMDATALPSGTVYPALRRLERAGLVVASWEEVDVSREAGRPARKYYAVTAAGRMAIARAATVLVGGDGAADGAAPDYPAV